MAIYHYSQKSLKCGKGKSAVQHASYISGDKLQSERTGLTYAEHKSKGHIAHAELSLPKGIVYTRQELWNFCEMSIPTAGQNWAKYGDFALPVEWSERECIDHAREFLHETFIKKGYAVDWALHDQDGNPHIDYMVTPRAFSDQNKFRPNEKKVYANTMIDGKPGYDPARPTTEEYRIPVIDPKTGTQKIGAKNRRMWKQVSIQNDGISSKNFLKEARKNWQDIANKYLEPDAKIDCRSYAAQGKDQLPGIHIGVAAMAIQERAEAIVASDPTAEPMTSDRYAENQNIKYFNFSVAGLRAKWLASIAASKERIKAYRESIAQLFINTRPAPTVKPWTIPKPKNRELLMDRKGKANNPDR